MYEGKSVNRSQIDMKRKTCDVRTWRKYLFLDITSTNIHTLVPSLYQRVQTRSIEVYLLLYQPLPHLCFNFFVINETLPPSCEPLYATNTSHRKQVTHLYEYALHWVLSRTKAYNSTLLFGSILHKHGRHFDYWNQSLNMLMDVCYLGCHEVGLYCYLVIHIKTLLDLLQLFYFHLWPIYLLSLVFESHNSNTIFLFIPYLLLILIYIIVVVIVFLLCSVSFIVCVVLCAVFRLSVVLFCVMCVIVVSCHRLKPICS
jgi:hypothetical protein